LVALIGNDSALGGLRIRALNALAVVEKASVLPGIERGLQSGDGAVRSAARELLSKHYPDRAVNELERGLASDDVHEQQSAIAGLGRLHNPAAQALLAKWMAQLMDGTCPTALQLDLLEVARQSHDEALANLAKQYDERRVAEGPLASYLTCAEGGDAERGQSIFRDNTAISCRRCHSTRPGEVLVGPNLADVGAKRTRIELVESIVVPNAKITEGFQTTVMELESGKVVPGIVRREDANHAVLVDPDGKEITVDLAEVVDRFEGKSAMPEDVMKHISPRDLRDLVEYLSTLRTTAASR
jgi:quinoprotein glucose dehydrogenase